MPDVFNWHIKRDMPYPYEGARPDQQIAYVFSDVSSVASLSCCQAIHSLE